MWFWRRFFSFSVLTVSFGLGLGLGLEPLWTRTWLGLEPLWTWTWLGLEPLWTWTCLGLDKGGLDYSPAWNTDCVAACPDPCPVLFTSLPCLWYSWHCCLITACLTLPSSLKWDYKWIHTPQTLCYKYKSYFSYWNCWKYTQLVDPHMTASEHGQY